MRGLARESERWLDHMLTDVCAMHVGNSERGVGISTCVLSDVDVFRSTTIYLDQSEVRDLIRRLTDALKIDGQAPV